MFSGTGYYWNPCLSCFLQKQEDTNHLNANRNFFNNILPQYLSSEDIIKISIRLFAVEKNNFDNVTIMLIVLDLTSYFISFVAISIMCLCLDCRSLQNFCGDHCMTSHKYLKATRWKLPKWVIHNSCILSSSVSCSSYFLWKSSSA